MKPFATKTRVSLTLRGQKVLADAQANLDRERVELIVELWDTRGRSLDWTLSRAELALVARAAADQASGSS
jgi:hypothetical protein